MDLSASLIRLNISVFIIKATIRTQDLINGGETFEYLLFCRLIIFPGHDILDLLADRAT